MNLIPKIQNPNVPLPDDCCGRFQVVDLSADPDHFVVKWRVESPGTLPGRPGLALDTIAAETIWMAVLHSREAGQLPELLSMKTDYFDCRLPLKLVVAEVDRLHHGRGILSLEAYLYHQTEKLLAKASATFATSITL